MSFIVEKGKSGGGPNSSTTESSETSDEEQDESSFPEKQDVEDVLASFREKWQRELQISPKRQQAPVNKNLNENTAYNNEDFKDKAKSLFLKGVEMEKAGKLYEAIQFYRRAVQLVPDIEFHLDEVAKNKTKDQEAENCSTVDIIEDDLYDNISRNASDDDDNDDDDDDIPIIQGTLLQRIQKKVNKTMNTCLPQFEQKSTHISVLPTEIILYILRWVVTSDLDLRSLEMFSMVCRGFYLSARDSKIWKSACERAWGLNCGNLPGIYSSWRLMFLERARLHYNGCYISKTTYIRHGESSFQDQFYRPWHLVAYYRYLRFFPEGLVLMLTTADEPSQCVGQLKNRTAKGPSILTGHYRLKDNTVTIVVQHQESVKQMYKRSRRREAVYENAEQTFHIELQIQSHHRRKHVQLVWTRYSVFTRNINGSESNCTFDLGNRFPPLWFSRVKSYTSESESLLQ